MIIIIIIIIPTISRDTGIMNLERLVVLEDLRGHRSLIAATDGFLRVPRSLARRRGTVVDIPTTSTIYVTPRTKTNRVIAPPI